MSFAKELIEEEKLSIRQACRIVNLPRSNFNYAPEGDKNESVREQLQLLIEKYPAIGFWQCYYRLRRMSFNWNHKRVYKVYTELGLNIRRRMRKRLPARVKHALFNPQVINQTWSIDFMSDSLWDGRKIRLLNVIDDCTREVLWIEADTSLPTQRVIRVLEALKETRGLPEMIRVDNGPEFISFKLDHWCKENHIALIFIQPGKPSQNAFIERCNGNIRKELLNAYVFRTLEEVRIKVQQWKDDYNYHRPHSALNYKTPIEIKNEKMGCYQDVEMLKSPPEKNNRDFSIFQYPKSVNN
jgi:putative transposase